MRLKYVGGRIRPYTERIGQARLKVRPGELLEVAEEIGAALLSAYPDRFVMLQETVRPTRRKAVEEVPQEGTDGNGTDSDEHGS